MTEREARRIVYLRSQRRCEMCKRPATDWAHRIGRGVCGLWLPSNGLDLCRDCHMWTHHNRVLAELGGWIIRSGEHPLDVPVWIHPVELWGAWWLLDDAGCYSGADLDAPPPERPVWAAAA